MQERAVYYNKKANRQKTKQKTERDTTERNAVLVSSGA